MNTLELEKVWDSEAAKYREILEASQISQWFPNPADRPAMCPKSHMTPAPKFNVVLSFEVERVPSFNVQFYELFWAIFPKTLLRCAAGFFSAVSWSSTISSERARIPLQATELSCRLPCMIPLVYSTHRKWLKKAHAGQRCKRTFIKC